MKRRKMILFGVRDERGDIERQIDPPSVNERCEGSEAERTYPWQVSAGEPAKMKEIKIPSPSSPPTMLNPSPPDCLLRITCLASLHSDVSSSPTSLS